MESRSWLTAWTFCLLLALTYADVQTEYPRTLVLVNDLTITTSHSEFFQLLEQRGHRLNFSRTDDSKLALSRFGEYIYDNLIIFAPSAEDFGGTVDVSVILEFVDSGRNLLLAASPSASEAMREIALECGIKMDETNSYVQVREVHSPRLN
jgi:oligosaccharyltransferase complex subunit beta